MVKRSFLIMSSARISQKDIARLANVSQGTVSAVLNNQMRGNTKVSEATRKRILEIAEKYNYRPNQQARQLRGVSDGNLIGVFVNEAIAPIFYGILIALEQEAQARQLQLIVGTFGADAAKNRATLTDFSSFNLAGVIVLYHDFPDAYDLFLDRQRLFKRVLFLDPADFPAPVSGVEIDYADGIRRAVDHLATAGRRRIAICQRDLDYTGMKERFRGYREGLAANDLVYDPNLLFIQPEYIPLRQKMADAVQHLVVEHHADAIIAGNDEWGIALMKELTRAGMRIPQDVAVIGFANYDRLCIASSPELSAVQYATSGIARAFFELLNRPETEDFSAALRVRVKPEMKIRESSAPMENENPAN